MFLYLPIKATDLLDTNFPAEFVQAEFERISQLFPQYEDLLYREQGDPLKSDDVLYSLKKGIE